MTEKKEVGIDLLKKLIKEVVELGDVVNEQLKDGWQVTDLWPIFMEGKDLSFVMTNWSEVRLEFNDLTTAEIKKLTEELVNVLDIKQENILNLIEASIDFAESGYILFSAIKGLKKPETPVVG